MLGLHHGSGADQLTPRAWARGQARQLPKLVAGRLFRFTFAQNLGRFFAAALSTATFLGLDAVAGDTPSGFVGIGDASVIYRSGTINVLGNFTSGIFASADVGSATITTLPGTSITVSQQFSTDTLQPGVDAFSSCIASLPRSRSAALRGADDEVRISARAILSCWTHLTRGLRRLT